MFTEKPTTSTAELNIELGDLIYALIKTSKWISEAIKASMYDPENIIAIEKEIKRILSMRWKTEVVTPAEYDEEWKLTKEVVMRDVEITSDKMTVATVLADFPVETFISE